MCGIVGYVGPKEAVSFLVEGLARLEYRGYDSAGVAVLNGGGVETRKLAGRIAGLRSEEHTSELQSRFDLVCRLLRENKKKHHRRPFQSRNKHPATDSFYPKLKLYF